MSFVKFLGIGSAAPEKILSNLDLEKMIDTSDEWILSRTGIVNGNYLIAKTLKEEIDLLNKLKDQNYFDILFFNTQIEYSKTIELTKKEKLFY